MKIEKALIIKFLAAIFTAAGKATEAANDLRRIVKPEQVIETPVEE